MLFDYRKRMSERLEADQVGRFINKLGMKNVFLAHSTLNMPWALEMPPMLNCIMFHFCISGTAVFRIGHQKIVVKQGDFILFPKGEGHILSDGQCNTVTPLSKLPIKKVSTRYEQLEFGGTGSRTNLICGAVEFKDLNSLNLMAVFPSHITTSQKANAKDSSLFKLYGLLQNEVMNMDIASQTVISKLFDLMLVNAIRNYLNSEGSELQGWLNALEDERIGYSLELIHAYPEKHWSLDELAKLIGMSRTSFINQFKKLIGSTPIDYLTECRMKLAYKKLLLGKESIITIALDVGYQSESAFSRAFKKVMGTNPRDVRNMSIV